MLRLQLAAREYGRDARRGEVHAVLACTLPGDGLMASIPQEILIEATPEHAWAAVRDVGAVHLRLVPCQLADTRPEGPSRTLTFAHAAAERERLVALAAA